MIKPFSLICLFAICSFQFSLVAHAQFLPADNNNGDMLQGITATLREALIVAEEEDFLTEENENFDLDNTEDTLEFEENTLEEIRAALSENFVAIITAYSQLFHAQAAYQAQNSETEAALVLKASGNIYINNAKPFGDALGNFVADGLGAFRQAQETGGDAGAAVGSVVAEALLGLNDSAQAIGDVIQQEFDAVLVNQESVPDAVYAAFDYEGEATQRLIIALANRANEIGEVVAQAVNDAVSQGGSMAEQLGHAFAGLVYAIQVRARDVGEIMSESMAGFEGVNEEILAIIRDSIKMSIQSSSVSADEVGSQITSLVEIVTRGGQDGRPAQNAVEIIDRLGQVFVLTLNNAQQ